MILKKRLVFTLHHVAMCVCALHEVLYMYDSLTITRRGGVVDFDDQLMGGQDIFEPCTMYCNFN